MLLSPEYDPFHRGIERRETGEVPKAKERGPWNALSKEEKIALYRAQYQGFVVQTDKPSKDEGVKDSVVVGCVVTFIIALFYWLNIYLPQTVPPGTKKEEYEYYYINPAFYPYRRVVKDGSEPSKPSEPGVIRLLPPGMFDSKHRNKQT